jgi:hypothetical protein
MSLSVDIRECGGPFDAGDIISCDDAEQSAARCPGSICRSIAFEDALSFTQCELLWLEPCCSFDGIGINGIPELLFWSILELHTA